MNTGEGRRRPDGTWEQVRRVQIKPKASTWVRGKLEAEQLEKGPGDEPGLKQLTVRMPAEEVAFIDVVAERFKVSRNAAVSILIGSACGDVYEALPVEEREKLLEALGKVLGCGVKPYWVRDRQDDESAKWEEVHDDDERTKV